MNAATLIVKLRDRAPVGTQEITWFAQGLANGDVSDAQAGAFAMAVLLNGVEARTRIDLTCAMRDTGRVLTWDLPGPVLDKHSTGGVGDCVSLLLAPALAACGAYMPQVSGRGLGHTGGTLDKMEAIPGFNGDLSADRFQEVVRQVGCAIVGASADVAPADRRLYAIRDVTGTVESIDLITASILSKKLAANPGGLVLDVKAGSGAFMKTMEDAETLARTLVETANGAGCPTVALITDMDQPLASTAGNALELAEVMRVLTGDAGSSRLVDLTCALGGEMLAMAGLAADADEGAAQIATSLRTGAAAETFGKMVAVMGGPSDFVTRWAGYVPAAPVIRDVTASQSGVVQRIDTKALGMAVVELGGGRKLQSDVIDPSVGLSGFAPLGQVLNAGSPLCRVHAADSDQAEAAVQAVRAAYGIGADAPDIPPLVSKRIN